MPSSGVTISVTAETNAGGRKHMEDYIAVSLSPKESLLSNPEMREQAFVGVFDGHGGKEAAKYAREHLWSVIQDQVKFLTHDPQSVREAIRDAYIQLHRTMEESRALWVPNKTGDLSTAGTTASTVIFRKNHIFVANVGDSTGIMGVRNPRYGEPGEPPVIPRLLTKDHKPEDPEEQENIRRLGGEVALSLKGVMRVVWERERTKSNGKKEIDRIPFLSVARSLGDFWSYCAQSGEYTVSPVPYIHDFPLDLNEQKFIVLASDGLWNVMSPSDVVNFITDFDRKAEHLKTVYSDSPGTTSGSGVPNSNDNGGGSQSPRDVVSALIREALSRWERKKLQADNIAVLIAYLSEEEEEGEGTESAAPAAVVPSVETVTELKDEVVAVSCLEEPESHQCKAPPPVPPTIDTSSSSSSSSLSPFEKTANTKTGSTTKEYFMRLFPDGSTVEYENIIKHRQKRKHKKKSKKASKHKTLLSPMDNTEGSTSYPPQPIGTTITLAPPLATPTTSDTPTNIVIEESGLLVEDTEGLSSEVPSSPPYASLHKRPKEDEEEEDEGVSSPHTKRFKEDIHTLAPLPIDFSRIRSSRISTDNSSDSGSSGIVSDMDTATNTETLMSLLTPPPLSESPLLCATPKLISCSSSLNEEEEDDTHLMMECLSSEIKQQE